MATKLKALRALTEDDKIPPQARVVFETLVEKAGVGNEIDREVLVEELKADGKLQTRQDVGRIVSFYQPKLMALELLEVTKEAEPKPVKEKTERKRKPKKAEAPAADEATETAGEPSDDAAVA